MANDALNHALFPARGQPLLHPGRYVLAAIINLVGAPYFWVPTGLGYFVIGWNKRALLWVTISLSRIIAMVLLFLFLGDDSPGENGEAVLLLLHILHLAAWIEGTIHPAVLAFLSWKHGRTVQD